jgi:ketosteroid isomerase-like protein
MTNTKLVNDYLAAFYAGDFDSAEALVAADFKFKGRAHHRRGREAIPSGPSGVVARAAIMRFKARRRRSASHGADPSADGPGPKTISENPHDGPSSIRGWVTSSAVRPRPSRGRP